MFSNKLKLRSLPAQLIPVDAGVIIRRGVSQVKVDGLHAVDIAERIFKIAREGTCVEEIAAEFGEQDRDSVISLIEFLFSRNFLIPCSNSRSVTEKPIDIFYWHFDPLVESTKDRISKANLGIVGLNALTKELVFALEKSCFQKFEVIDHACLHDPHPALDWRLHGNRSVPFQVWNAENRWKTLQCLVVCSDVGGGALLHEFNHLCISQTVPFFPVVLRDMIGYIGPLILPGETACYECLTGREDSHLENSDLRRTAEQWLPLGREIIGHHPAMYSVVANLAAFELTRFFSRSLPGTPPGTLIEVNLLTMAIKTRKILKLPRCTGCSSMMTTPSMSLYKGKDSE